MFLFFLNWFHAAAFQLYPRGVFNEEVADVMNLFASFLEVDPSKHVHESPSNVDQYYYLPNTILNFAYKSRVDSGF